MCAGFTPNAHDAPCRKRASEFDAKTKGTANGFPQRREYYNECTSPHAGTNLNRTEILAAARVFVPLRRVGCFVVTAAASCSCC